MNAYEEVDIQLHSFLISASGELHTPDALPPGKDSPKPTEQGAGCAQEREGGINFLPLPGIELDHSLVSKPTELRRLTPSLRMHSKRS